MTAESETPLDRGVAPEPASSDPVLVTSSPPRARSAASHKLLAWIAAGAAACTLAAAQARHAHAATSCGIVSAAGRPWILVANGVPCSTGARVVRSLAARTAAVRAGSTVVVPSPLPGFKCVLASHGKPGGSCSTAGATKSLLWLGA